MMKKILIFAIFCLLLTGVVSAYEIRIDTPQSLQLGETIVVNGTTSLPAGVSFDIRLTRSEYTAEVKDTKHVTVQGDKNFSVEFPTTGFTKGVYKVEILPTGEFRYLGDSITMRVVTLVDRSDEVKITSLPVQYMNGVLHVTGSANNVKNSAIEAAGKRSGWYRAIRPGIYSYKFRRCVYKGFPDFKNWYLPDKTQRPERLHRHLQYQCP